MASSDNLRPDSAEHRSAAGSGTALSGGLTLRLCSVAMIGVVLLVVYSRALHAPFVLDDENSIENNPSIRQLWPLIGTPADPGPLRPRDQSSVAGRPLVNLTLAFNYHFGGFNPLGYHVFNLVVHGLSTILLLAIVARTLRLPVFAGRFLHVAEPLALAISLIWSVHPLQTEAVEYITQRSELMVAFFYLGAIYASVRFWQAASSAERYCWCLIAAGVSLAGMASKEVMVSAPLVVLLFDWTLRGGSFRHAVHESWTLYVALAVGWGLLLFLNFEGPRSETAGFHVGVPVFAWWMTQCKVLLIYLKLVLWPHPLVLYYEMPYLDDLATAWPWVVGVVALAAVAAVLVWKRTAAGFLLAAVFVILSPTMLVPIATEVAAERRMYLPLAAIVTLVVTRIYACSQRIAAMLAPERTPVTPRGWPIAAVTLPLVIALGWTSARRLATYNDLQALWVDAVRWQPENSLAHLNLGVLLAAADRFDAAIGEYETALQLQPKYLPAHLNLALALQKTGRVDESLSRFNTALQLGADDAGTRAMVGVLLLDVGRVSPAIDQFLRALALAPDSKQALHGLARARTVEGDSAAAEECLQRILASDPQDADAHYGLALLLVDRGEMDEATRHVDAALRIRPRFVEARMLLGKLAFGRGDFPAAAEQYSAVVDLQHDNAQALNNLGAALMNMSQTAQAIAAFRAAVNYAPDYPGAKANLEAALESQRQEESKPGPSRPAP